MVVSTSRPAIAETKSAIMTSEPLKMRSPSALARSIHSPVGPAITSILIFALDANASAASFMAGAGPPGPNALIIS